MGVIYLITNTITGMKYVGQTKRDAMKRFKEHCTIAENTNRNLHLYNSMRKYGVDKFTFEILESDVEERDLDDRERYYIEKYDTLNTGYNYTAGGGGMRGYHHSEETRRKFGASISKVMWKINTPERTAKIIAAQKGRKFTEEHKRHIKEAVGDRYGENNPFFGKQHSEETRDKISSANSEHTVNQIDPNSGEILNTFCSVREAAKFCIESGYTKAKLSSVMYRIYATSYGRQKIAYSFGWEFVC